MQPNGQPRWSELVQQHHASMASTMGDVPLRQAAATSSGGRAQAQLALGNGSFPVLLTALREERGDTELVRGILECLVLALQPSERARPVRTRQTSPSPLGQSRSMCHQGCCCLPCMAEQYPWYTTPVCGCAVRASLRHSAQSPHQLLGARKACLATKCSCLRAVCHLDWLPEQAKCPDGHCLPAVCRECRTRPGSTRSCWQRRPTRCRCCCPSWRAASAATSTCATTPSSCSPRWPSGGPTVCRGCVCPPWGDVAGCMDHRCCRACVCMEDPLHSLFSLS